MPVKRLNTLFITLVISLIPIAIPSWAQSGLQDSLLICLPFNGNTKDLSGNAYDGIAGGNLTYVTDRVGRTGTALYLDGTSNFITLPRALPDSRHYSFSVWVKLAPQDSNRINTIFMDATDLTFYDLIFDCTMKGVGIRCDKMPGGTGLQLMGGNAARMQLDTNWHHIVWTARSNVHKVFVDGVLRATVNQLGENVGYHPPNPALGSQWSNNTSIYPRTAYFKGALDDFKFYTRALTAPEVQDLYNRPIEALGITVCGSSNLQNRAFGGIRYRWFRKSSAAVLSSLAYVNSYLQAGSTDTLLVEIQNVNCTLDTIQVINRALTIPAVPTLNLAYHNNLPCSPDTAIITASFQGPGRLEWNDGFGSLTRIITSNQSVWAYTTESGCRSQSSDTLSLVFPSSPQPLPDTLPNVTTCKFPLNLSTASGSYSITWHHPGGTFNVGDSTSISESGTHRVLYRYSDRCTMIDSFRVSKVDQINLDFEVKATPDFPLLHDTLYAFFPQKIKARVNHITPAILWQIQDSLVPYVAEVDFQVNHQSLVSILLKDLSDSCFQGKTRNLYFKEILIPNIVTANGDNRNDYFEIPGMNRGVQVAMSIYDRWGGVVHSAHPYQGKWPISSTPTGLYFIYGTIKSLGQTKSLKAWVEVVR